MRLPVPQIPWGRANQFGDLMRVLKFRAVHFDYRAGISKEDLRRSLDNARLAGAGGPQEQQISDWAPWRAQPGTEHLIELDKRLHGLVLPNDLLPQRILKMARRGTPLSRVQLFVVGPLCCCCHDVSFTVVTRKNLHSYQTLQASLLTERRRLRQHCRSGIQAISCRQA